MAVLRGNNHAYTVVLLSTWCLLIIACTANTNWFNHGGDLSNRRYAEGEVLINPLTVSKLRLKWKFFAGKDITATPAIADGIIYFPSWNGHLYAVRGYDGSLVWDKDLGELTGLAGTGLYVNVTVSRATPTVVHDLLITGIFGPAIVIAVKRSTGELVWMTQLDPRPRTQITMSGTFYRGYFYVGISSLENFQSPPLCCTFRGSMVKLDARSGALVWQTYTIPDNGGKLGGYSGAAVWGSSPSIDIFRNLVYVGTGQLYTAPPEVVECQKAQTNKTAPTQQCIDPNVHYDSILAFDMDSGDIRWFQRLEGYDVFSVACLDPTSPYCPPGPNLDADFGEAPMLLSAFIKGRKRDLAVAVQKSGYAWALDRDTGDIIWSTIAGPGGLEGGGVWGSATDGRTVYTNIVNTNRANFTLAPSAEVSTAGGWVALDASTGRILWTTADPTNDTATAHGPVSLAFGVLFAGSVSSQGPFYAMDSKTGKILWSYDTSATVYGGASVSNGCIYLGNGYTVGLAKFKPTWTGGTSLYAFCIA
ncbi:hypothetical protein HHK36_024755 [Tetracentron sinense]|uniref:Pyrrolo-quinoline quinone repeat domain-containing protein n=1 Tax=Tetracentron sinense TaxID=13715 RepID=A0A834YLH0_TETSI|nr:hypothetical protein HHK36_024755 [Tetracentron sinense]